VGIAQACPRKGCGHGGPSLMTLDKTLMPVPDLRVSCRVTNEQDAAGTAAAEDQLFGAEALPPGSALLVVKRGPNAGSRFLLDQPTTTAGRHPNSDIFLDVITVSRRHAQFRCVSGEFQIATSAASTTLTSTVNPWTRRCWRTATRCRSANFDWCF